MKTLISLIFVFIAFNTNAQFFQFLDSLGDGTGRINHNLNYSSTPDTAFIENTNTLKRLVLYRMIVSIQDANGMIATEYGNLNTALTNGIIIKVLDKDNNVKINLTSENNPIKYNAAWAGYCYDADVKGWGTGDDVLAVRWTFANSGKPITLLPGWKLIVILNDDLTGLTEHHFHVQGYEQRY